jgi:hypothetical protein
MHVARQWGDHSNVLELSCKGRGHLRSTGTFGASDDVSMPFPFKGSMFSTALSPSKEEEENLVEGEDPSTFHLSTHRLARQVAHVLGPRGHAAG